MERWIRAGVAGVAATGGWALAERPLARLLGTGDFGDVRLLGRLIAPGRLWPVAGLAVHLGNGAAFGVAFDRLGLRGVRDAVLVAEAENVALWPVMALLDRIHPDRRSGHWPPLVS